MTQTTPASAFADKAFREELRKPVNLRAFLRRAIPEIAERLDFDHVEYPETKLPFDDWRSRESDLLVEIPYRTNGGVYEKILVCILLEHQSKTDARMPLRTLIYSALYWDRQWRDWESQTSEKETFHLRPLLPVVLYANSLRWGSARTLADLFHPDNPFPGFTPRWEPLIWELASENPKELLNSKEAFDQFLAVVRAEDADPDEFGEILSEALERLQDEHADQKVLLSDMLRLIYAWAIWQRPVKERPRWNDMTTQSVRDAEHRRELKNMSKRAIDEIYEEGYEVGVEFGIHQGKNSGIFEGTQSTLQSNILRIGQRRFLSLDPKIEELIRNENDLNKLQLFFDRAISAKSWDEVFEDKAE